MMKMVLSRPWGFPLPRPARFPALGSLLVLAASGCSPDTTSFEDLQRARGDESTDAVIAQARNPAPRTVIGASTVSVSSETSPDRAIECAAALRVVGQLISVRGGGVDREVSQAIGEAESEFRRLALNGDGTTDPARQIEQLTSELLQTPGSAGQKAISCLQPPG